MQNKYCAFLRGVNVNGTNMKMTEVASAFQSASVGDVTPVLASGNIIFSSDKNKNELRLLLEKAMSDFFSYQAFLFVKSKRDIEIMLENNPFSENKEFHNYVFICENGFEKTLLNEFNNSVKYAAEEAEIHHQYFYWKIKKGVSLDSDFSKILGKKQFKSMFTSRNLNTIEKVLRKM